MKNLKSKLLILISLTTLFSASAPAYAWIGGFHHRDITMWRGGRWYHGWHDGRIGWWWAAAGAMYYYSRPVYPYPDPYVPSTVIVQQPAVVQPQVVEMQQPAPPQVVAQAPVPPPAPAPAVWYQCKNPAGYYPYIPTCPGGWTAVPAAPTQ